MTPGMALLVIVWVIVILLAWVLVASIEMRLKQVERIILELRMLLTLLKREKP